MHTGVAPTARVEARATTARAGVPRVFQVLIVIYVVFTGEIPVALQGALFGFTGGGEGSFGMALLSAVAIDLARLAPLFVLARHPLGVLHPLIIAVLLWPLLVRMPTTTEEFGGLGGLFLGSPVEPPFFIGLGWRPPEEVWGATAFYNLLQLLSLLATYAGFAVIRSRPRRLDIFKAEFDTARLRLMLIVLIGLSFVALLTLMSFQGGLAEHLAGLARGRFRALAGLGPLVALVDLGTISVILWVAARPRDARTPIFLGALVTVALAQFVSNGSRSATLLLFMLVGLTWALRSRRIPWRLAAVMAPLVFMSLGLLSVVRTSAVGGQSATEALTSADSSQVLTEIQEEIAVRRSVSAQVPIIANASRVTGFMWGETYLAAVLAVVPRFIWEDKPRGPGSLYAQRFLGEEREGTSIPVGPTAEAYWNFHIPGVILIFLLYGVLLRKAHDLYLAGEDNPFVVCFFVLFVASFRIHTDELTLFQQQMALFGLVYVLARLFVRRRDAAVGRRPRVAAPTRLAT